MNKLFNDPDNQEKFSEESAIMNLFRIYDAFPLPNYYLCDLQAREN